MAEEYHEIAHTTERFRTQAFASHKRTYLAFLRAAHQTQLVSAVAELSLRDFPKGLPSSVAGKVNELFR
jgi:hypothetical protein